MNPLDELYSKIYGQRPASGTQAFTPQTTGAKPPGQPPSVQPLTPQPGFVQQQRPQPRFAQPPGQTLDSIYNQYAPQETGLKENLKRHNILKALGESMGALGGMVSAHQGGPVVDQQQGAAQGLDQYQAALQDWENKKRHHELMQMQEAVRGWHTEDQRRHEAGIRQDDRKWQENIQEKQANVQVRLNDARLKNQLEIEDNRLRNRKEEVEIMTQAQKDLATHRQGVGQTTTQQIPDDAYALFTPGQREPVAHLTPDEKRRVLNKIMAHYATKVNDPAFQNSNPRLAQILAGGRNATKEDVDMMMGMWHTVPEVQKLLGVDQPQQRQQNVNQQIWRHTVPPDVMYQSNPNIRNAVESEQEFIDLLPYLSPEELDILIGGH